MRKVGDMVRKKPGAGFIGEALTIKLINIDPDYPPYENHCFICESNECKEWSNCMIVDESGNDTGHYACHVSECEMQDI